MNSTIIESRFTVLEMQLNQTRRQLRTTWIVSVLAAVAVFTAGWHKEAIAQGYGMTLAQAATRIAALETKTASMTATTDSNTNQPTVRFSGVNVQIVNGTGSTQNVDSGGNPTPNGVGNLIVGYNETGNLRGDARTGSHNLVVGPLNNYSGFGGAVIGYNNAISGYECSVVGGESNTASNGYATVSGGNNNTASGGYASVSGGNGSTASGFSSSVSGGVKNMATSNSSSVSGGRNNTASAPYSSVSGGYYVQQTNQYGFSAGGQYTLASPGVGVYHSP